MQIRLFLSSLNVDDLGKKWGVRIVFTLLILLNFFYMMFPIGSSDFTAVYNWYEDYFANPDKYLMAEELVIPFTRANYYYIASFFCYLLIMILIAVVYAAIFMYSKRIDKKNISKGLIVKRTIIFSLFFIVIFPIFVLVLSGMSFLFFAIMPVLSLIMCSYVSGDHKFGESFGNGFKMLKGQYFSILLNFIIISLILNVLQYVIEMFSASNAYYSIVCVLAAALNAYTYLVLGRLMGTVYLATKGIGKTRIIVRNNNL